MGGKANTPPVPNYQGIAQQQSQSSQDLLAQQTAANRPNENTPWGAISWNPPSNPYTGTWSSNETLNPNEQALLTGQQSQQVASAGAGSNLFNTSGMTKGLDFSGAPKVNSGSYYTPEAQNAVWGEFQNMQMPLQHQQTESEQSQLEAQGLRPGDAAYDNAMRNLSNTQYTQQQSAEDQAVLAGEQEAQAMQGMDVQAQNQYENSQMQERMGNLNMFNSFMGTPQNNVNIPSFAQSGMAQTPNLLGAASEMYGGQLNATNAQNAAAGNMWNGILGAIGSGVGMYAALGA